jgi:hypothetical protein
VNNFDLRPHSFWPQNDQNPSPPTPPAPLLCTIEEKI